MLEFIHPVQRLISVDNKRPDLIDTPFDYRDWSDVK